MSEQLRNQSRDWKNKNMKKKTGKQKRSNDEQLTTREIEELMGINRPTYRRGKGGAFRQR